MVRLLTPTAEHCHCSTLHLTIWLQFSSLFVFGFFSLSPRVPTICPQSPKTTQQGLYQDLTTYSNTPIFLCENVIPAVLCTVQPFPRHLFNFIFFIHHFIHSINQKRQQKNKHAELVVDTHKYKSEACLKTSLGHCCRNPNRIKSFCGVVKQLEKNDFPQFGLFECCSSNR